MPKPTRQLTDAQRAYESKRAAKAGMSLDKWLAEKQKQAERAQKVAAETKKPAKPPGFISRLLDRAHKPL